MFDIYGVIDLRGKRRVHNIRNPFRDYPYYDFDYREHSLIVNNAAVLYLERQKEADNYLKRDYQHLFIYGFVFASQELLGSAGTGLGKKLSVGDVFDLYREHGLDCVNYIKGSFTLVLYHEEKNRIVLISDQLNVQPLYYACKNGLFVFSSALKPILDSSIVDVNLDKTAIAEFAVFDYPLGNRTFYSAIKTLEYAQMLIADQEGLRLQKYFSVSDLFQDRLYNSQESIEMLSAILHSNGKSYVADTDRFLLSLTGGFDCRMNLALLDRPADDFLCYSYGMPGSRQLEIPIEIARRLQLNYTPIVLGANFENEYEDCALRALFYSDGTAPIIRANYPYAFRQLKSFSDVAITGLFGSEVMRPLRNMGIQINKNSESVFIGRYFDESLKSVFEQEKSKGYIKPEILEASYGEVKDYLLETYFSSGAHSNNKLISLYHFFIAEGVRKYFVPELKIERIYIETRFPFFDFDFVKAIFHTPYAGLYNGALKESPIGRRNAQSLYAQVIKKYRPALGHIRVDRGYRPADLSSPLWFLKILPGYIKTKHYYRQKGNDTFATERWTDLIFSKNRELMKKKTDIFPGTLFDKYEDKVNLVDNYCFSRIFSLKYWFEHDGT